MAQKKENKKKIKQNVKVRDLKAKKDPKGATVPGSNGGRSGYRP